MSGAAVSEAPFAAIIVAAGSGTRFGQAKHDVDLAGTPLWRWSVDTFEREGAVEVIVVGDVPGGIPGGSRRRDSVLAGLTSLTSAAPIVLIHDAARPLVGGATIDAVREALNDADVDGAIPALSVTDTIKRIDGRRIVDTVDRTMLVAVQTPQAFRTDVLIAAHGLERDDDATDDASLVEIAGGTVVVVDGDRDNLKITFPGDLDIAEAILAGRARS